MARLTVLSRFCVVGLVALVLVPGVTATCYCVDKGQIIDCSGTESTCGKASSVDSGAQLCCVTNDQCGADSLCHFTKEIENTSGYYLGGCTDPTYKDPVCQQHCTDAGTTDVVYNTTSGLWTCCGYPDGSVSCQDPRQDTTFQAIALNDFPGTSSAAPTSSTRSSSSSSSVPTSPPSSSSSVATSSPSSSSSAPAESTTNAATSPASATGATAAPSQSASSGSGMSTGATAGAAVGGVIGGLALIGGLAYFFMRRRRLAAAHNTRGEDNAAGQNGPFLENISNNGSGHNSAFPAGEGMSEMFADPREAKFSPGDVHEVDSSPMAAQLYGSESRQVSELP